MRILITGGTGFIGSALTRELREEGHAVIITTRHKSDSENKITWNPPDLIPADIISTIDAVINLAGEPIAPEKWTEERKERIMSSRVETTRALVASMKNAGSRPKVLISASAIGYYGAHGDEVINEVSPPASDFLAGVCKAWEAEALKAEEVGMRVVLVRIGGVLEKDGGVLKHMSAQFNFMMGGPVGDGEQWFSWIHRDDIVGIFKFALQNDSVSGPVNGTAPNPVTNLAFSTALGKAMKRPSYVSVPAFVIKMALGELADILITGQRVVPEKALKAGYQFKHTEIKDALKTIFEKR
ncbi:MAG: TIGR01777 family oxidoreductase [Thermodesulfovibrionia bacterium]|nr:TIGR01777 family oxidoreductase [Thermodesulfovibrionia bacterium]